MAAVRVSVVFWLTAQQAGTSLTVFAANHVAQNVMMLGRALRIGPGHSRRYMG